jgi:CRISPR/Cas system-associated endoribonuclease Cas2
MKGQKITEELKSKIRSLFKQVVSKAHHDSSKQIIKEMPGRITMACPQCGDSTTDLKKKRGNLYWDTLQYHCFNCGIHSNAYQLLKDHHVKFKNTDDSIQIIDYIQEHKMEVNDIEVLEHDIFKLTYDLSPTRIELSQMFGFKEIVPGDSAYFYLKNRLLSHRLDRFMYSPKDKRIVVLNLAPNDKVIGFQTRSLNKQSNSRYLTYDLEKIYQETKREMILSEEELVSVKKLSTLFGVMLVDFQREVTMFEGPIDAMFISNSIGLATAGRSTTEFDEIPTIRYMFDNDSTGKRKMMEKLKRGKKIFTWERFFKETKIDLQLENFLKNIDKNERDKYPKQIGDLNDLVIAAWLTQNKCLSDLDKYFSDSKLDAYYL